MEHCRKKADMLALAAFALESSFRKSNSSSFLVRDFWWEKDMAKKILWPTKKRKEL